MAIRPIETRYRGYRFRSRLEARWAVFFDAAEILWEYEPQGFVLNDRPYLPDFYLPDLWCYFEVKPTSVYDLDFLQSFAYDIGTNVVVAEGGIPDPSDYSCAPSTQLKFLSCTRLEELPDDFIDDQFAWGYNDMFLQCDNCDRIRIMNAVYSSMRNNCSCGVEARMMPPHRALQAARSARFEHGERG